MTRIFESYSINYLSEIKEILLSKICTNKDNAVCSLEHQEFFGSIYEMVDSEIEIQIELENILDGNIKDYPLGF